MKRSKLKQSQVRPLSKKDLEAVKGGADVRNGIIRGTDPGGGGLTIPAD